MHDPRIGRFFALDPLAIKYPHYSPYSFSGNKVIHRVEIEGLEDGHLSLPSRDPNLRNASSEELEAYNRGQNQALMWSCIVVLDLTITRGAIAKTLATQYVQGVIVEYISGSENPFSDGLGSIDVFDATLEGMLSQNNTEANKIAVNVLSSLADVGYNGEVTSVTDGSKPINHMVIDLAFNIVNDKITFLKNGSYGKVGEKIIDLSTADFNKLIKENNVGSVEINMSINGEKVTPKTTAPSETKLNDKKCLQPPSKDTIPTPEKLSNPNTNTGTSILEYLNKNK